MSEIRNLTRNGETFYPQTHVEGILDPEGNYIGNYEENPEYIEIKTDSENKILEGIKTDGTKHISGNLEIGGTINTTMSMTEYIENPEWIKIITDSEDRILAGIKKDGSIDWSIGVPQPIKDYINNSLINKVDKEEGKSLIDSDYASSQSAIENPEFLSVELDSDEKVLGGRKIDGTKFENVGLDFGGSILKGIDDPEGRMEIKTDSEQKIISYRKDDGTLVENAGIETNHLELTEQGMTDFQKALRQAGLKGGAGDWSDYISNDGDTPLHLPTPLCASINFTGITSFPSSKTADLRAVAEFTDFKGNYFKKNCILNAHGQQTLIFPKKNITVDFLDEDYDGDAFVVSFGDWVGQDSFHLKAYYIDNIKGKGAVAYKLYEDFMLSRGIEGDRPYRDYINSIISSLGTGDLPDPKMVFENRARCYPDGFPCVVYLNGEFYGLFAFQLKKHRDNYLMDKKTATNIHIEGKLDYGRLFDGSIDWTGGNYGLEVRNPKSLYYQKSKSNKAEKYDFDTPHIIDGRDDQEIMGTDSAYYDASNKDMKRCAKVKQYIEAFSNYIPELKSLKDGGASVEEIKAELNRKFGIPFMIDYLIFQNLIGNDDSIFNNCQWTTYDGEKWYPNPYDLNYAFTPRPVTMKIGYNSNETENLKYPFGWCWTYFADKMAARYTELKDSKVIDAERITRMIEDWINNVGTNIYVLENDKWPAEASLGSVINTDFWKEVEYDASYQQYDTSLHTIYSTGNKVNYVWKGENKSYEAKSYLWAPDEMRLVVTNNRITISQFKERILHNMSNLDTWFNV